jgi:hypothetical protein
MRMNASGLCDDLAGNGADFLAKERTDGGQIYTEGNRSDQEGNRT